MPTSLCESDFGGYGVFVEVYSGGLVGVVGCDCDVCAVGCFVVFEGVVERSVLLAVESGFYVEASYEAFVVLPSVC